MGILGGVACGAASDGSAGNHRRTFGLRRGGIPLPPLADSLLEADEPGGSPEGPSVLGCVGSSAAAVVRNPRAGVSLSNPEPASGSPPRVASEPPVPPDEGGSG